MPAEMFIMSKKIICQRTKQIIIFGDFPAKAKTISPKESYRTDTQTVNGLNYSALMISCISISERYGALDVFVFLLGLSTRTFLDLMVVQMLHQVVFWFKAGISIAFFVNRSQVPQTGITPFFSPVRNVHYFSWQICFSIF